MGNCSEPVELTILDILSKWDEFKKTDWIKKIEYPELSLNQYFPFIESPRFLLLCIGELTN